MKNKEPRLTLASTSEQSGTNSSSVQNPYSTHEDDRSCLSPPKKLSVSSTGIPNPYVKRPKKNVITPSHEPTRLSPSESAIMLQRKFANPSKEPLFDCRLIFSSRCFSLGRTEFALWCNTPSTKKGLEYIGLINNDPRPTNPFRLRSELCLCSPPCMKGSLSCPYQNRTM